MATTLHTETRTGRGKNQARQLRRDGRIPGVVYGDTGGASAVGPIALSVDPHTLTKILRSDAGVNTLIGLSVDDGAPSQVLIKDYLVNPLSRALLHVDFYRVAMDKLITVVVPVLLTGESEGVKQQAGMLEFIHREIPVECLPGDIPEHIEVDVTHLMLGQGVRVRDVLEPARWTPAIDVDTLIVHVIAPKVEEEATEEEATDETVAAAADEKGDD